jgi:1,2-dihydroxy-3-keto-5-methylthiopentene dioxygenase
MASISIPDQQCRIDDPTEIVTFLAPLGIHYENWNVAGRITSPDASSEEILAAYAPEIERLKAAGGYVTADVISISPDTPNLDALLARFCQEHTHSEDEVRFIIKGRGVFHIHPDVGPVFGIELEAGDLLNVPRGTKHWFDLCNDRTIRAIRLFQETTGWTPHYVGSDLHHRYQPLCWGLNYFPAGPRLELVIKQ